MLNSPSASALLHVQVNGKANWKIGDALGAVKQYHFVSTAHMMVATWAAPAGELSVYEIWDVIYWVCSLEFWLWIGYKDLIG